jgi:hypothetical protein
LQAEPSEPLTYFTTLIEHHIELARGARFGQLAMAALKLQAPLIQLTWSGDFPTSTYDLDHTYFEMPDIKYMDTAHLFYFDSQNDFSGTHEGVCFMPILGFETTNRSEGLIVRPTSLPASAADGVELMCYMRIGMATIRGDDAYTNLKAIKTHEIALL